MRTRLPVLALGILLVPAPVWAQFRPVVGFNFGQPRVPTFGGGWGGYGWGSPYYANYGTPGWGYPGYGGGYPYGGYPYWGSSYSVFTVPGWTASSTMPGYVGASLSDARMRPTYYPAVPIRPGEDIAALVGSANPGIASKAEMKTGIQTVKTEVASPGPQPARLQIHLPSPDAELWIENVRMSGTGANRTIVSPPLAQGSGYHYTIRARWLEGGVARTETRRVPVRAGQPVQVDFTKADSVP